MTKIEMIKLLRITANAVMDLGVRMCDAKECGVDQPPIGAKYRRLRCRRCPLDGVDELYDTTVELWLSLNPHPMQFDADQEVKEWLASRQCEAFKIDAETAEVMWWYAETLDPYGVDPDLPEECRSIGREYFARRPGSDIWVWSGDLPTATLERLLENHERGLSDELP